jgi:T4-like virus tail tube protein gp19
MAFAIQPFIAAMAGDGARPNLFEITFAEVGGPFTIRAQASAIPSSRVGVASAFYFGREAKFAGNRVFDNWTVDVIVDETDYVNGPRSQLEKWMNGLNAHVANLRDGNRYSPNQYQKDATITHFGKKGDVIGKYEMKGCFPVNISAIGLAWNSNDNIETFSVEFALQWWQSANTT